VPTSLVDEVIELVGQRFNRAGRWRLKRAAKSNQRRDAYPGDGRMPDSAWLGQAAGGDQHFEHPRVDGAEVGMLTEV